MNIREMSVNGQKIIPSLELDMEKGKVLGIQTNVQRKKILLAQFAERGDAYLSFAEQGEYTRLTVEELLRFMKSLSGHHTPVRSMLQLFQLGEYQKVKIADLPASKKIYLSLLRVYYAQQPIIVLEEPYFQLEEPDQLAFKRLLEELSEEKQILILTANLEDALISCDEIYRLDEAGLHLLDITDAEDEAENAHETGEAEFKIQKIPTKKNDKTILFNPPEIDYIESINSSAVVHVAGETYTCALTLAELEDKLQHYGFFRCHRSYIVNLQKVRELITWTKNSYSLRLTTGKDSVVPLSRTKLAELKELLNI
ncbi:MULTISPECIES: LytTR family transcriptional regulator DNA-binding domain-containing protein [Planococcus]|uniref:LytTR family transcriptional regulator n=1 Tax=Planococcus citreus TaxID=1373 RepID=A0A497YN24_9BACL|nr:MULTISPECIES: LytTR family transcriptional regulator DNA-binding domain-containing protein [Planococcus]MDE0584835.1 LytTR family transcriptional regulator DNA-binding domain-containing protein [Planococcus sp. A6]RLJ91190.1 LytTR family transcriptional regulator [Planococcus citreus]